MKNDNPYQPDKTSVVERLNHAAKRMRDGADELERYAKRIETDTDQYNGMEQVGFAINSVTNIINNLGLDSLVGRMADAYQGALERAKMEIEQLKKGS